MTFALAGVTNKVCVKSLKTDRLYCGLSQNNLQAQAFELLFQVMSEITLQTHISPLFSWGLKFRWKSMWKLLTETNV